MVQIIEQSGNIAGRIGKGFAQGLSDQLPKEIERGRLSSGLEKIANQSNLTPLQQSSHLLKSGFSPEQLSQYLPLLQKAQQTQAYLQNADRGSNEQRQPQINIENVEAPTVTRQAGQLSSQDQSKLRRGFSQEEGEIPLNQQVRGSNYLQRMDDKQKEQETAKLIRQGRFLDPEQARAYVDRQDNERLQGDKEFKGRQDLVENEFNNILQKKLQKSPEGTFIDLSGELQEKLLNKAKSEVALGANPNQVASKYSQEAFRLAQAHQNLRKTGSANWFQLSPSNALKQLQEQRKAYEKVGGLEEFANEVQSTQDLSKHYARNLAYPLTKEVNNLIANTKGRPGGRGIGSREKELKLAEEIGKNINPDDSIFSIGLQLHRKGLDDETVLDYIRDNYSDNLNQRQLTEFQEYKPVNPNIADIFLYTFFGMNPLEEIK